MLLLGEGSEATEPYNNYDKIRPHSIRSLQFDQKVRPLSFRPEKFDLFTATLFTLCTTKRRMRSFLVRGQTWVSCHLLDVKRLCSPRTRRNLTARPRRGSFWATRAEASVSSCAPIMELLSKSEQNVYIKERDVHHGLLPRRRYICRHRHDSR